ncbi:hypothetical protein BKC07_04410 [Peribacillus simplex]|nr:hypothetical protein BKC07_04410 [Peribacillus simplex]
MTLYNVDSKDKVSIIIPTYKRNKSFLTRALDSVLNQSYKNIEIVIVDDNASNELIEFRREVDGLIKTYQDPRVKYIQNKNNLGGSLSRNAGIEGSTGNYITFLDDDDMYLPDKVKNQLGFMISGNYDMSFTNLRLCNSKGKTIDYREYNSITSFTNEFLLKYHMMRHITGTPTFMYKKEAIEEIGGFSDAKMGQEFFLMTKTIQNDLSIGYLKQADVIAFVHEGERISNGANKFEGEKALYKYKKSFFNNFSFRERMFIRFRHHIVMAITGIRSRFYFVFFMHTLLAILSSPIDALREPISYIKKIKNHKNN